MKKEVKEGEKIKNVNVFKIRIKPVDGPTDKNGKIQGKTEKETWKMLYRLDNETHHMLNKAAMMHYINKNRKNINDPQYDRLKELRSQLKTHERGTPEYRELKQSMQMELDALLPLYEPYYMLKEEHEDKEINTYMTSRIDQTAKNQVDNNMGKIRSGDAVLSTFKKGYGIQVAQLSISFEQEGQPESYYFNWTGGSRFQICFGRGDKKKPRKDHDLNNEQQFIDIFNKWVAWKGSKKIQGKSWSRSDCPFGDSVIKIKKNKVFLYLSRRCEPKKIEGLRNDVCVGVDLGLAVPAYAVVLADGKKYSQEYRDFGDYFSLTRKRVSFDQRLRRLRMRMVMNKGGHGREKLMKAADAFAKKEKNYVRTYLDVISRKIINLALKNNAGIIKLELLDGIKEGKLKNKKFIIRYWSYAELQTKIEQKALAVGITVLKVDPYHTSQTCPICGHFEKGQRLSRGKFKCKNPECKDVDRVKHADYVGAMNIALRKTFVLSKEETTMGKWFKERDEINKNLRELKKVPDSEAQITKLLEEREVIMQNIADYPETVISDEAFKDL